MRTSITGLLVLLFVCVSPLLRAQDAIFSQFYASPVYLNPAFAGSAHGYRFVLNYRDNPASGFSHFRTFNTAFDHYVPALGGGLALLVTSDHAGNLLVMNQISAIYSVHLRLTDDSYLHFGAQAGYFRKSSLWNRLDFPDPTQAEPPPGNTFKDGADFASGLLFYHPGFYAGVSVHHLSQPNTSIFNTAGDRIMRKYTFHAGAHIPLGGQHAYGSRSGPAFLSPNIIFQHQEPFTRINYGLYAGLEPLVAGIWLRQELTRPSTLVFLFGYHAERFKVGYSYDHWLSGFSGLHHATHEISLIIQSAGALKKSRYRILNCPGF